MTELDLTNEVGNLATECWSAAVKKRDMLIFQAFERYGYSREQVLSPEFRNRIEIIENEDDHFHVMHFMLDNVSLFEVVTETKVTDWDDKNYIWNVRYDTYVVDIYRKE